MNYFSVNLDIGGDRYTRGDLCDLMGLDYKKIREDFEKGVYKAPRFSSIFIFSSIDNALSYYNRVIDDSTFLYSGTPSGYSDEYLTQHRVQKNELLLFIREDDFNDLGFLYFGRCELIGKFSLKKYFLPVYKLKLLETSFSLQKDIGIPICGGVLTEFSQSRFVY